MKKEDNQMKLDHCVIKPLKWNTFRGQLSMVTEEIIAGCQNPECFTHVDYEPIPSVDSVIEIISGQCT